MYLFEDKEEITVSISCKLCLKEIKYTVTAEEYKNTETFPIEKVNVHGDPAHRLIVKIDKNLEIGKFKIEDVLQKEVSYSEELTRQVLSDIGLNDQEIELYFKTTGRDAVSLGEMALLIKKTKEECKEIAEKFVDKGLFKPIVGARPHYTALPPYAALISQLKTFHSYIAEVKKEAPKDLTESFTELEANTEGVKRLKDYTEFMENLKQSALEKMYTQKKVFDNTVEQIEELRGVTEAIAGIESDTKTLVTKQIASLKKQFDSINTQISTSMQKQLEGFTSNSKKANKEIYNSMKDQILELNKQFNTINETISGIMKNQIKDLTEEFKIIQNTISENIQKLRLGVIQQTVNKVIKNVFAARLEEITENLNIQLRRIQKFFKEELKKTSESLKGSLGTIEKVSKDSLTKTTIGFNRQIKVIEKTTQAGLSEVVNDFNENIVKKLKNSISDTVVKINDITRNTSDSGEEIKKIFAEISKDFSQLVVKAEEKISGISDSVFESFGNLKETFSSKIIATLNDVLQNILDRLEVSEVTTNEFWEKAKERSLLTMQDIWFVRSPEGAQAHIKDEISKVKMRLLIVTPELTDIDIESLKNCARHINIRIATYIDPNNANHAEILADFDEMHNLTYRHRDAKNLWGINRDYEEVILCVVSKKDIEGEMRTEIAGIGSIIQEHIKIFVPILEEAWMGAKKDIAHAIKTSTAKPVASRNIVSERLKQQESKTASPQLTQSSTPPVPSSNIVSERLKQQEAKTDDSLPSPTPSSSEEMPLPAPTPSPAPSEEPLPTPSAGSTSEETSAPQQSESPLDVVSGLCKSDGDKYLTHKFDLLKKNLDNMTGQQIAQGLQTLVNDITDIKGYSATLKQINLSVNMLQNNPNTLNPQEKGQLENKMNFWRKKLHI